MSTPSSKPMQVNALQPPDPIIASKVDIFTRFASAIARMAGHPSAFLTALGIIVVWGLSGPLFHYSDTWQLVINTGTTIVTFLMVFLIQNSQNRDGAAIQAKLDELIRVSSGQNSYIGIEHLNEKQIDELRRRCEERAVELASADVEED